jgi:hypothetical protein
MFLPGVQVVFRLVISTVSHHEKSYKKLFYFLKYIKGVFEIVIIVVI